MTTGVELSNVLSHVSKFKGIFSKDQLPKTKSKKDILVVNLEDHDKGNGTHWVGIVGNYYFDPFGLPPPPSVIKYMKQKNDPIIYSNVQLQDVNSSVCGEFVVDWIRWMLDAENDKRYLDFIYKRYDPSSTEENSKRLQNYF